MPLKTTPPLLCSFSKKEKIAALMLLAAIVIALLLPATGLLYSHPQPNNTDTAWMLALRKPHQVTDDENPVSQSHNAPGYTTTQSSSLFPFDPNTTDAHGFKKLGLRDKTVQIILNYRNKGGRFREKEDLKKIYGLRPGEFERLEPYITIATANNRPYPAYESAMPRYPERKTTTPIDINEADTTAWKSLRGIGPVLAARIVHFREKLGGFHSIRQVGETFGLPDSTYQHIKPFLRLLRADVRKLNINKATYNELEIHPYISKKLAYQIVKLRRTNGNFKAITEIGALTDGQYDQFDKLSYYITTE